MKTIKRVLLMLAAVAAISVPAAPASATTCIAADPTVDYVVCDTVYPVVARAACKIGLLCY
jgi:hypothetical protein